LFSIGSRRQRGGVRRTGFTQAVPVSLGKEGCLIRNIAVHKFLFVTHRSAAVVRRLQMGADHSGAREALTRGRAFPRNIQFDFIDEPLQSSPDGRFARIGGGLATNILPASAGMGRNVVEDSLVRARHERAGQKCEIIMSL
jgi:hypothetical protein